MVRNLQVEMFSEFYEEWMGQLEDHFALLLRTKTENSDDAVCVTTVNKLTAHHKEYYTVKWAQADVLSFFSPVWLTPLEKSFLWFTGWKPSIVFRLLDSPSSGSSFAAMTEDQTRKIKAWLMYIKAEEKKVEMEMETQQRRADQNIVTLRRLCLAPNLAAVRWAKAEIEGLLCGKEKLMKMADCVRLKTFKGVLEVLNPTQSVEFLASMCTLQIKMRG